MITLLFIVVIVPAFLALTYMLADLALFGWFLVWISHNWSDAKIMEFYHGPDAYHTAGAGFRLWYNRHSL